MATAGQQGAKSDPGLRGRILAIDYGRKRLGLALSDELRLIARPAGILVRKNRTDDLRRLRALCQAEQVTQIVVGYPLHIGGEAGEMASEAMRYAFRLGKQLGLPVVLLDERLTSWEAERMAKDKAKAGAFGAGRSRGRQGEPLDDLAAAILLREHLAGQVAGVKTGPAAENAR